MILITSIELEEKSLIPVTYIKLAGIKFTLLRIPEDGRQKATKVTFKKKKVAIVIISSKNKLEKRINMNRNRLKLILVSSRTDRRSSGEVDQLN